HRPLQLRQALPQRIEHGLADDGLAIEDISPDDVEEGKNSGLITAVKLYPAGATTNSHGGVRDMEKAMPVLERMAKI
ncbi:hypothetical protein ACC771_26280, partial [Rhizobium ruizarguesonis]